MPYIYNDEDNAPMIGDPDYLDAKRSEQKQKAFDDLREWVKNMNMKPSCVWCPKVEEVYGYYKDPDDEWKAMERLCEKCKFWGWEE
jgi:hypothetical protein